MKRFLNIIFSILALILIFPVWIIICAAIKFDSKGPVIFKQKRVGKNGKIFTLLKFRTMHSDSSDQYCKPKSQNDPRITRIGKFLRNRGLDEIPQLINVIKGDMSLIGPRPEIVLIAESYSEREKLRLKVNPGITGLWQVMAPKEEPIHQNLKYDLYYIRNRNLWMDSWIIFQTFKILIGKNSLL